MLKLAAIPEAPATARHHIADLPIPPPAEVLDYVLLIVSELVTNAVQHAAASQLTLQASISIGCIRIAVHDFGAPILDGPQRISDAASTSGRGLIIVSELASRWGVVADVPPPGKTVWAELDL